MMTQSTPRTISSCATNSTGSSTSRSSLEQSLRLIHRGGSHVQVDPSAEATEGVESGESSSVEPRELGPDVPTARRHRQRIPAAEGSLASSGPRLDPGGGHHRSGHRWRRCETGRKDACGAARRGLEDASRSLDLGVRHNVCHHPNRIRLALAINTKPDHGLRAGGRFLQSLFLELVDFPLELAQTTKEQIDVETFRLTGLQIQLGLHPMERRFRQVGHRSSCHLPGLPSPGFRRLGVGRSVAA